LADYIIDMHEYEVFGSHSYVLRIANGLNGNPRRVFADILKRRAVSNQIKAVVEFGALRF
jgi:hypothetical protein